MGDIADWILSQEGYFDYVDDRYDILDEPVIHAQKEITCRSCGTRGFIWKETPKGWRLQGMDGTIHNCY